MINAPIPSETLPRVTSFLEHVLTASTNTSLDTILLELREVFEANEAGLGLVPSGEAIVPSNQQPRESGLPWQNDAELAQRIRCSPSAIVVPDGSGSILVTNAYIPSFDTEDADLPTKARGWTLWVTAARFEWSVSQRAALALVAQTLGRWFLDGDDRPRWADQLEKAIRQQGMKSAGKVIGRLAHDYGNIFTSLVGFTELSLAKPLPASNPIGLYLDELHTSAKEGVRFTERLRLMSRHRISHPGVCEGKPIFEKAIAKIGGAVHLDLPEQLPELGLDGCFLEQILDAVLTNAREASGDTGEIRVAAEPRLITSSEARDYFGHPREGYHLEITVRDSGTLDEAAKKHLFSVPFFTSKTTKKGVGLSLVYGILESHEGGIRLDSTPSGTEVRILIPCLKTAILDPASQADAGSLPKKGARILVVDDDPTVLPFLKMVLEEDYQVTSATGADDALQKCRDSSSTPFDLVVSDVYMPPGPSGVELANQLLQEKLVPSVLFISGHVDKTFLDTDFSTGQYEFLAKPFPPEDLSRKVEQCLRRSSAVVMHP